MDNARYEYLERQGNAKLTPEEMAEGWHWCCEFDYLLVGPGMPEQEYCLCFSDDAVGESS